MLFPILAVVIGLLLLVWSAERFVMGASATARNLGISPLLIGLTIVGIGTSSPEIFISAMAASRGNPGVSIGNAIGSNIANIGLVIGVTALLAPLSVRSRTLKREFLIMFVVMLIAGMLLLDQTLSRSDGIILMVGFGVLMAMMCVIAFHAQRADPMGNEYAQEIPESISTLFAVIWLLIGLVVLLLSSRAMVWGAIEIARALSVSDLIIGLTIVAIGTSLPELAASVMSALKGDPDIAIGNVIGSNMFNLLLVLSLPGLIAPGLVAPEVVHRDYLLMLLLSGALFLTAYGFRGPGCINRLEGALLMAFFRLPGVSLRASAMSKP